MANMPDGRTIRDRAKQGYCHRSYNGNVRLISLSPIVSHPFIAFNYQSRNVHHSQTRRDVQSAMPTSDNQNSRFNVVHILHLLTLFEPCLWIIMLNPLRPCTSSSFFMSFEL